MAQDISYESKENPEFSPLEINFGNYFDWLLGRKDM
jgi:hypothetical protein